MDKKFSNVVFESDSQICIRAISQVDTSPPWRIQGLISDIKARTQNFPSTTFLGCTGKLILLLIPFLFSLLKILYMALLPLFVVLRILQVLFRRRLSLQLLYSFLFFFNKSFSSHQKICSKILFSSFGHHLARSCK
jgi:hypothetical protein